MALKPEVSLGMALATGAVVYGIYTNATPSIADIRSLESGNADIQASERNATWTAAAAVAAISLLAKDPTIFIVGGTMVVVMAWTTRHADLVDNVTKKATLSMADLDMGYTPSGITEAPEQERVVQNYGSSVF